MAFSIWPILRVATVVAATFSAVSASNPPLPTAINDPTRDLGAPISLESALAIEFSVLQELAQMTGVPPVPLPTSIQKDPAYKSMATLAGMMPPIQSSAGLPNFEEMLSQVLPPKPNGTLGSKVGDLSERSGTLRIMIVGDSISQGQQGDWTWRYRLYQWLQSQNVAFTFVGPYTGTFESTTAQTTNPQPPQPPPLNGDSGSSGGGISVNGGYAAGTSQSFLSDSNHFTNWGRAVATDQYLIENMLNTYPADLVLVELGFNDMGWFYSDAYGTLNSMQNFVSQARNANPNAMFAIANVPQRTYIREDLVTNISTYNSLLQNAVSKWSQTNSPVWMVDFEGNYDCGTVNCPAGYDGLHPNAWGEYQIANAFSKALIAGFNIGQTALAIPSQNDPSLVRSLPAPSNFQVFSSPQGVSATWDPVYGAYSYSLQVSINGGGAGWSGGSATVNRFDSQWPSQGGHTQSASQPHAPQLAGPPTNVIVTSTSQGIEVSWDPPTGQYSSGIVEYNVIFWDTDPAACQYLGGFAVKQSPALLTGLTPGGNYLIAPVAWNSAGQGWPNVARQAIPGGGVPGIPGTPQVISNDATSVHVSWNAVANAAGYELFMRNSSGTGPYTSISNTTQTCNDDYFLFPGAWNYEFAVAAWNGNAESGMSPAQPAPRPASTVTEGSPGPTCAPPPPWCPNSGSGPGSNTGGSAGGGSNGNGGGSGGGAGGGSSIMATTTAPLNRGASPTATPATPTYSSPPSSVLTPLCAAKTITPQMWQQADIGGWLNYTAQNDASNQTLLQAVANAVYDQKELTCTLQTCDNGPSGCWSYNSYACQQTPQACIALYALLNWGNMLVVMQENLDDATTYVGDLTSNIIAEFWPNSDQNNQETVGTSLSIAAAMLGLVPVLGDALEGTAEITNALIEGLASSYSKPESEVAYSNFTANLGDTFHQLNLFFGHLVDDNLNSVNPPSAYQQPNSVVQLLQNGLFAQPPVRTSNDGTAEFVSAFAAVPINWLWSQVGTSQGGPDENQVVVIKASSASLGFNPCGSTPLWNSTYAVCDANDNIYALQYWQYEKDFSQGAGPIAVPGISNLGNYNITIQQIIDSVQINQNRGGFLAQPPTLSQLAQQYGSDPVQNNPISDLLQFNLPFCDLDTVDPGLNHPSDPPTDDDPDAAIQQCQEACGPTFQSEETTTQCNHLCTWYVHMYCECWQMNGWPYPQSGDQCQKYVQFEPNPPPRRRQRSRAISPP